MRNPAVTGNIVGGLVFCGLPLGSQLVPEEDPEPDQERHGDNRWRRQSGQVSEQGTPLSAYLLDRPASAARSDQAANHTYALSRIAKALRAPPAGGAGWPRR